MILGGIYKISVSHFLTHIIWIEIHPLFRDVVRIKWIIPFGMLRTMVRSQETLDIIIFIFPFSYFIMKVSRKIEFINLLDSKVILSGILTLFRNFIILYYDIYQVWIMLEHISKMDYIEFVKEFCSVVDHCMLV